MLIPCREERGAVMWWTFRPICSRDWQAAGLSPVFSIKGQRHVMLTQTLAAVPSPELREVALSLRDQRETVLRALDLLLTGG